MIPRKPMGRARNAYVMALLYPHCVELRIDGHTYRVSYRSLWHLLYPRLEPPGFPAHPPCAKP